MPKLYPTSIKVTHHPRKGRCVTAEKDIKAGDIVHVSRPYAIVPDCDQYKTTCAHCVSAPKSSAPLPVQCLGGCERTFYCDENCRKKDWRLHRLQCASIRDFLSMGGRTMLGLTEEYARLLIRVLATRFDEIEHENEHLADHEKAEYVEDGTPIPLVSSIDQRFDTMWKLVSNAENYSSDRLTNEFLPVALCLTRMVAVHLFPLLPENSKYETPELLLPQCTDKVLLELAEKAVMTNNTPISQNPLFTELFEPVLVSSEGQQKLKMERDNEDGSNKTISSIGSHPTKLNPATTVSLLASSLSLICKEECNSFGHYSFSILGNEYDRQGYAVGVHTSAVFFNHSCSPNVGHVPRSKIQHFYPSQTTKNTTTTNDSNDTLESPGMMVFFAIDDIPKGQELCLSYVGVQGLHNYHVGHHAGCFGSTTNTIRGQDSIDLITPQTRHCNVLDRRAKLKKVFTFDCDCTRCIVELSRYPEERHIANRLMEELRASGGAGVGAVVEVERLEVEVERRVGFYACGVDGCKAFLVPKALASIDSESGLDEFGAGVDNMDGVIRVCEGCQRLC
ncbi:hypothetical protein BDR26DRAFT_876091 [Obelidium mucronatum]|nr:hypothetical protein BDR26DRAFT_876091 [Obelidium mucronatum]